MPLLKLHEKLKDFVARYAGSKEASGTFPNQKQRVAVAYAVWREKRRK